MSQYCSFHGPPAFAAVPTIKNIKSRFGDRKEVYVAKARGSGKSKAEKEAAEKKAEKEWDDARTLLEFLNNKKTNLLMGGTSGFPNATSLADLRKQAKQGQ